MLQKAVKDRQKRGEKEEKCCKNGGKKGKRSEKWHSIT